MLLVMEPSKAFKVETRGFGWPSGHKVRYPNPPTGTTVALKTYACAVTGGSHTLCNTSTGGVRVPLKGWPLPTWRVSMTRQGAAGYSDSPPGPAGAKEPLMSMIRSGALLGKTEAVPLVP